MLSYSTDEWINWCRASQVYVDNFHACLSQTSVQTEFALFLDIYVCMKPIDSQEKNHITDKKESNFFWKMARINKEPANYLCY